MADTDPKVTYPQYTNLALGEGLVDQLMATVNHHLDVQYDQGRISGSDFANVYVGSIAAVMQFSTQYLLGTMLIDEQKSKADAETSLLGKQELKIDGELALIALQEAELRYRIEQLLPLEKQRLELEVIKTQQEGLLITAQITKIDAEITYLAAQEAMMLKQADKIDKEIEFLTAKIATELANTQDGAAGLIGKQIELLVAQRLGFAGDIQVKAAKVYADYDSVVESVAETGLPLGDGAVDLLIAASSTAEAIG